MQHIGHIKLSYSWGPSAHATQTIHVYWSDAQQQWLEKCSYDAACQGAYHAPLLNEFVVKAGLRLGPDWRGFRIGEDRVVQSPQGLAQSALFACGACEMMVAMSSKAYVYRCETTDSLRKFFQQDVSDLVLKTTLRVARVWRAVLWKHAFSRRFVVEGVLQDQSAVRVCSQIARNFDSLAEYLHFMRANLRYMHAGMVAQVVACGRAYFIMQRRVLERRA